MIGQRHLILRAVLIVYCWILQKAFDSVPHQHLLLKLECLGIHGDLLKWLNCYILLIIFNT